MEPRPDFFPVYVSGQYLTSEHLNETHDFLWQEEKATRYLLDGNGVVSGFLPDFTDNTSLKQVSLAAGSGSTIDGYLVEAKTAQTFDKGISVDMSWLKMPDGTEQLMVKADYDKVKANMNVTSETVLHAIEIFLSASKIEDLPDGSKTMDAFTITASQALSNYIVAAWVYINDAENDHCQQGDCNTKGIQRNYITRYFLFLSSEIPQQNFTSPEMPVCIAARIKNLSGTGSSNGFYTASLTAWNANNAELGPYFSTTDAAKKLDYIGNLLSAAEQTALTNAIKNFAVINASATKGNCPEYYNAFASDLSVALNELTGFYNEYVRKYPTYSPSRIERTILFGGFRQTGVDKWRYYFIPATEQVTYIFEKKKLSLLFMRAVSLVNNFILQEKIGEQAKKINKVLAIPTSFGDTLLQNRAIPYYYDVLSSNANNEILKYWNPQGGNLLNIFCYYDAVIPARNNNPDMVSKLAASDWANENFFRIEGHVGLKKEAAISAINALIVNNGLPIQLLDCDVNYKGPLKWIDWYGKFSQFVMTSLETLKQDPKSKSYAYDPLKKIQTVTLETSYRNTDKVKTILNDFTAYSGVFYNTVVTKAAPKAKTKAAAKATGAAVSLISPDVVNNYKKVITQAKITDLIKGYNDAVVDVKDPAAKKMLVLKDLAGLEYLGGVPKGGTFVLLHNQGIVIGDGCLPYFYRVAQARVYDV